MKKKDKTMLSEHLKKLQSFNQKIEDLLNDREEYFEARSERWQEGERGDLHSEVTEYLESVQAETEAAIENIKSIFEII